MTTAAPRTTKLFTHGQPLGAIRPNKLRDLHAALFDPADLSDAEFRSVVTLWLRDVTYAE